MIIAATFKTKHTNGPVVYIDEWWHAESPEAARSIYNDLLEQEDLHSASIGQVVESTDFTPTSAIQNIDFDLLREQKELLVNLASDWGKSDDPEQFKKAEKLEGLLHLIDAIQDEVVALGVKTEQEVFGKME